jgi:hypothetical protein
VKRNGDKRRNLDEGGRKISCECFNGDISNPIDDEFQIDIDVSTMDISDRPLPHFTSKIILLRDVERRSVSFPK